MSSEELFNGHQVTDGFRHLLTTQLEHAIVDPIAGELLACETFALGDLVLVVGEDQVIPAAVNIDLFSKVIQVHG